MTNRFAALFCYARPLEYTPECIVASLSVEGIGYDVPPTLYRDLVAFRKLKTADRLSAARRVLSVKQ